MRINNLFDKITCIIIGFIMIFVHFKYIQTDYIALAANNFQTDNTIYFTINDVINFDYNRLNDVQAQINSNYYAVYFNGKTDMPMLSGDFFPCNSTYEHNVVIGKNYINSTYEIDGNSYIKFANMVFRVCGVIGFEFSSPLDKNIYFYLPEVINWFDEQSLFATNDDNILTDNTVKITSYEKVNYSNILQVSVYIALSVIISLVVLFVNVFHSKYICENNNEKNKLMELLGYQNRRILFINLKDYLMKYGLFYIIGGAFAYVMMYKPYLFSLRIIFGMIFYLLLIIVSSIINIRYNLNKSDRSHYETYNL